jgi:muconolactone delta-isomerase
MNVTSWLYKLARMSADVRSVSSGDPKRMTRRAKNKALGRTMGKAGVWRKLWK